MEFRTSSVCVVCLGLSPAEAGFFGLVAPLTSFVVVICTGLSYFTNEF